MKRIQNLEEKECILLIDRVRPEPFESDRPEVDDTLPFWSEDGDEADGEGVLGVRDALRAFVEVRLI